MKFLVTSLLFLLEINMFAQPLVLPVRDTYQMPGLGWVAVGIIESGTLRQGGRVEVRGTTEIVYDLEIKKIMVDGREVEVADKWKDVIVLLSGAGDDQLKRGMIIGEQGYFKTVSSAEASITLSGKITAPIEVNEKLPVQILRYTEFIEYGYLLAEKKLLNPGDKVNVTIKFSKPSAIAEGEKFEVSYKGKIIASGKFD